MNERRRPMVGLLTLLVVGLLALLGVGLLALLVIGLGTPSAHARGGGERITAYDVEIEVTPSGSMEVKETIDYDFGSNRRHGIYRDIPVRARYDGRHDRVFPLEVVSVAGPDAAVDYEIDSAGKSKRIRIGDPDRTIVGVHRYTIVYRVDAALDGFPARDQLRWDAVGTKWSVPIEQVTVLVTTPAPITDVTCFRGRRSSRRACSETRRESHTARFAHGGMRSGEGITVVTGFEKGAVPPPKPVLEERWSLARAFSLTPATVGGGFALLAAAVLGLPRLRWWRRLGCRYAGWPVAAAFAGPVEHDAEDDGIPLELSPPDGRGPAQLGMLIDEGASTLDVSATIVDLAVRGYLRLDEIANVDRIREPDWILTRLKGAGGLRPYERSLHKGLFEAGSEVTLSSLRNTFVGRFQRVRNELYDDALARGWVVGRADEVRHRRRVAGVVGLVLGMVTLVLLAAFTGAAVAALPLIVAALVLLSSADRMSCRTEEGFRMLRRVLGFRRLIIESDKHRAHLRERQHLFSEYLPYAIAFGATKQWTRTFAGHDGHLPDLGWYGTLNVLTPARFSRSVQAFTRACKGAFTSKPRASRSDSFGGFSGGGVGGGVGGGAGGGGGGSW